MTKLGYALGFALGCIVGGLLITLKLVILALVAYGLYLWVT